MISKYNHKEVTWLNLEKAKPEEIDYLKDEYGIHENLIEKLLSKDEISGVSYSNDYIYGSFYFPSYSFSFILNKSILITLNNQNNKVITEFVKNFETDASFEDKLKIENTGLLLFFLIKSLYADQYQTIILNDSKFNSTKDSNLSIKYSQEVIRSEYLLSSHKSALNDLISEVKFIQFGERLERYLLALLYELKILRNKLNYQKNILDLNLKKSLLKSNRKGLKLVKILTTLSLVLIVILTLYVFSNI